MQAGDRFAARVGCIDGRGKKAAIAYAEALGYNRVDTITGPGIVASCVGVHNPIELENNGRTYRYDHNAVIDNAVVSLLVSIRKHGSDLLILDAHAECAGNPVSDEEQIQQLMASAHFWRDRGGDLENIDIHCLFIAPDAHGEWKAELVYKLDRVTTQQETMTIESYGPSAIEVITTAEATA